MKHEPCKEIKVTVEGINVVLKVETLTEQLAVSMSVARSLQLIQQLTRSIEYVVEAVTKPTEKPSDENFLLVPVTPTRKQTQRIFCGMCGDTGYQNGVTCPQPGCRVANGEIEPRKDDSAITDWGYH